MLTSTASRRAAASIKYLLLALTIATFAGCGTAPRKPADKRTPSLSKPAPVKPGGYYLDDGPGENAPSNLLDIPDAVPIDEPLHRAANRPYAVFGRTYVPNVGNDPFVQTGMASWYGRKFHGQQTSTGERYDMYAMTAAHPTLPLPSYARVTCLANGRSVVVRINDRGPFHGDRIIDLSYAAAFKLDIAAPGSGKVKVERLLPNSLPPPLPAVAASVAPPAINAAMAPPAQIQPLVLQPAPISTESGGVFIQLGAFSSPEYAESFREKMQIELDWMHEPVSVSVKNGLHRVRIGPLANREEAQAISDKVRTTLNISPIFTQP